MRRHAFGSAAVAGAVFVAALSAQGRDLSGKWVPDAEKNQASANAAAVATGGTPGRTNLLLVASPITVTQDAKTLTIDSERQNVAIRTVYNLDGSESKNSVPGRQGAAPTEQVSVAKWDGDKLVITTKTPNGNRVASWYLEDGELVSETQGTTTSIKVCYKKS